MANLSLNSPVVHHQHNWPFNSRLFTGNSEKFLRFIDRCSDDSDVVQLTRAFNNAPFPHTPLLLDHLTSSDPDDEESTFWRLPDVLDYWSTACSEPSPRIFSSSTHIHINTPTFPTTRRMSRRPLSDATDEIISTWFDQCGIQLGPLLTDVAMINRVKRLLYTYQDLNATELQHIKATDLYTHRVRLKPETPPWKSSRKKQLTPNQSYWLQKILNEGIACGMYERTITANGELSDWNAEAVVVPKPGEPEGGEMRITFNYRNVHENMPGTFLQLTSEVHDYLSDPRHGCFMQYDIKHAYWSLAVHPDDRHYFAFYIDGIGQLQPTRMPQGSQSAGFSMNELMYIALGYIPPLPDGTGEEPSLLASDRPDQLPSVKHYFDDVFGGHKDATEALEFLENHLLPRMDWAQLKLSFKKLKLFQSEILALGVTHLVHGVVKTKEARTKKIKDFPVPTDIRGIKSFLGTVGITRRWIANFSEIAKPLLSLLVKDQPFVWGLHHQVSFDLLREKCSQVVESYGFDFSKPARLYSDASGFGGGCCITQMRLNPKPPDTASDKSRTQLIEVPILFDSFVFTKPQRQYGTYKRELCAIVEFARKYRHYFTCPGSLILTDHKPLTGFLDSPYVEGIYARWSAELSTLNVCIQWIPGKRNVVADSLSRTVFPDLDSDTTDTALESLGYVDSTDANPRWIWKDGKGGYTELLRLRALDANTDTSASQSTDSNPLQDPDTDDAVIVQLVALSQASQLVHSKYSDSEWYRDVHNYLSSKVFPPECTTRLDRRRFLHKIHHYQLLEGELFFKFRGLRKRCIVKQDVADILHKAHDQEGHFSVDITTRKLRGYYWPNMANDIRAYIQGCVKCAKFSVQQRSQAASPISIDQPNVLLGMDFVGPFPREQSHLTQYWADRLAWPQVPPLKHNDGPSVVRVPQSGHYLYFLMVIDYFSRFVWGFPCITADSAETIRCLTWLFGHNGSPVGIYSDEGTHFDSHDTQGFLAEKGVLWIPSPVAAKKSTGMIEKANDIVQRVLKKTREHGDVWPRVLQHAIFECNRREVAHLNYTPFEIHFGYQPLSAIDYRFGQYTLIQARSFLSQPNILQKLSQKEMYQKVSDFMTKRDQIRSQALFNSDRKKAVEKAKHDLGVNNHEFKPQDLVFLYDAHSAKLKLHPSFRGPFRVSGFGGDHQRSFKLEQLNGDPIRRTFYGDHLRLFKPRTGHLVNHTEELSPIYQNIRAGRTKSRIPDPPPSVTNQPPSF
jgi:transposase InsO family protein